MLRSACLYLLILMLASPILPAFAGEKTYHEDNPVPGIAAGVKVVSEKNPDASSTENLIADLIKPGMSDREKAEAIFFYLLPRAYHFGDPEEPCDEALRGVRWAEENAYVFDTVKCLNVYGHGICGMKATWATQLWNTAGMLGRCIGVEGHTASEVKYGGSWHHLDISQRVFVRDQNGEIPSTIAWQKNPALCGYHAKQPDIPCFMKDYRGRRGTATYAWRKFKDKKEGFIHAMFARKIGIHSMNLTLREGESFTRYFKRQWAPKYRFYFPPWKTSNLAKRLRKSGPEGPMGGAGDRMYLFPEDRRGRYGNWELIYNPPLDKASALSGIYSRNNITHSPEAPHLRPENTEASAEVVYKFYSPYGCAGCPNNLDDPKDDSDGAIVEGEFADGNGTVSYSLDLGMSWKTIHAKGGKFRIDLTPELQARYCWLIKLSFKGKAAGLKSFRSYTSGQLASPFLPYVDGKTKMTFTRDDTDCVLFLPDITAGEKELRRTAHAIENLKSFDATSIKRHVLFKNDEGSVTFKVDVPDDIVRVQAGAKFACGDGDSVFPKPGTKNLVEFSIDDGKTWILACQQGVVTDEIQSEEQWTQMVEGMIDFRTGKAYSPGGVKTKDSILETKFEPRPARSILVRFSTRDGEGKFIQVNGIYVHYSKAGALPLRITHKWLRGEHVEKIDADVKQKVYTVVGEPRPCNRMIRVEAVSAE